MLTNVKYLEIAPRVRHYFYPARAGLLLENKKHIIN